MQITEMLEHLDRAQAEIQLVEEQLNDKAHACEACGLCVREDFAQHQLRTQLHAARIKLKRFVGALLAARSRSDGESLTRS